MIDHTPGPWETNGQSGREVWGRDFTGALKSIVDKVRGGSPEQAHANARLIAAAPDLLEALKRMGYQRADGWCFCCDKNGEESTAHQGFCKTARAAIAKVEGR